MNIRSVTAVGDHGNFILATDTEVWKYFAPSADAMGRTWPEKWVKIELPNEKTAPATPVAADPKPAV